MSTSQNQKILVIDPAASTGFCVVHLDGSDAHIVRYGIIDIDTNTEYLGDRCIELMGKIRDLIISEGITDVALEDYFFGSRFAQGSDVNTAYRTAIHITCRQLGLPYSILNVTEWKKAVAGRSTPTKEQKKQWGKDPAKKLFIQEALWDYHRFRFPNHSISQATGKPILFRYDVVDAVGMAVFYLRSKYQVKSISLDVPVPPDVPIKKSKKMFIYPEETNEQS